MSERVTVHPPEVEVPEEAGLEEYLAELRQLEHAITRDRARIEASRARTEAIWADLDRLRDETRAILVDLKEAA